MQKKLTEADAKALGNAADAIQGCFNWIGTDEGVHFWSRVVKLLKDKAANGTSDGKPYVEPEPPIPEGYRKANADEWTRKDVKYWNACFKEWRPRKTQGTLFDPPAMQTHYIVPIDPPLTDEDAKERTWVMCKDHITERSWQGPYRLLVQPPIAFSCVVLTSNRTILFFDQARRATPEEIEAANGNS